MMIAYKKRGMMAAWRKAVKDVVTMVFRENRVCKSADGEVDPEYVRDVAIKKADVIILADGGFLLAELKNTNMYISVVCANKPGVGKAMILRTLQIGREHGMTHTSLHALPSVLKYYPRFGFSFPGGKKEGSDIDGYYMHKNLSNTLNWRQKKLTPRRSSRLEDKKRKMSNVETPYTPTRPARRPRAFSNVA